MGLIADQLGLHEQALVYFQKSLALDPTADRIQSHLSRVTNAALALRRAQRTEWRFLVIKAWGYGFWSDVNHVIACLLLAEISGRIPVTAWGSNSLFSDGSGRDAFRQYFEPVSPVVIEEIEALELASFFPSKWSNGYIKAPEHQRWEGPGAEIPALYFLNRPETVGVCDYHLGVA